MTISHLGNAFAVCNSCINNCDGELEEAKLRPECYTSNKARLCHAHLAKYKINDIIEVDDDDEFIQNLAKLRRISTSTVSSFNSIDSQQKSLTSYNHRQMSTNDVLRFEQLFIRMTVSNGLPFFFVENEETKALFKFIAPGLSNDKDGITAAFNGWTNVKMEQLWDVVFITSKGQPLVWRAHEITFVSDSAGEYAAARRQMRRKYLMYFTGNLCDEQMRIYNKHICLASSGDIRWNSYYFCFYFILKTQAALKRLHIAIPIIENNNINNPEFNNLTDDDLLVGDDDNGENESNNLTLNDSSEPHTEEQEQEWNIFVKEWIEAIKRENTFDHSKDEILLDGKMDNDFNFGGRTIHPADNLTAKWSLRSLFISNLGFSAYLKGNQIYSAL
ncbi:hypothetical protein C1646_771816 [Rhizophagus diaphanus]|nr:hypothetical protein C1646_771816 [Rhizophagus diaphanus] [Rhizophagus sp. MUCL 43196]